MNPFVIVVWLITPERLESFEEVLGLGRAWKNSPCRGHDAKLKMQQSSLFDVAGYSKIMKDKIITINAIFGRRKHTAG
jgi:hypothetical protein